MPDRKQEVVLGAIVFLAIVILILGTVWLSENYGGPDGGYKLNVRFDSVVGLARGNPVTLRGVKVGKVLGIVIDEEGYPRVQIGFRPPLRDFPEGSRVALKSIGMLGEQMIEVHIGTGSETLPDGTFLRGSTSPGLEKLTVDAAKMAQDLRTAVDTLLTQQSIDHIRGTIVGLDSAVVGINNLVTENRVSIAALLDTLVGASSDARGLLGENRESVRATALGLQKTTESLSRTAVELEAAGSSLRSMLANLDRVMEGLAQGEGTLGKLLKDDAFYRDLRSTVAAIDSLVKDVKLNPDRYFQVSVF
jgi:phospholipid/cholesterol/gamma-HCH transport system substrate-binding protein